MPDADAQSEREGARTDEALSESVDWKLTETLLNQRGLLVFGGLSQVSIAALGYVRTGQSWFIGLGAAAFIVLVGRLWVNAAFSHRGRPVNRPTLCRRYFLLGTWASGALCGIGGAGSVLFADPFTQMLVITMLTSFVMGSAARNGVYPKAAIGSVLLAESPLLIACLLTRNSYYICYTFFICLFTLSSVTIVRHLYAQTVRFLVIDEEKVALVRQVSHSNTELAAANERFADANERLGAANEQLAALASTDWLTQLANRRSFDEKFEVETDAAKRDCSSVSVLMMDIDWFKGYNDRYGHQAGDACLQDVARTLARNICRPRDLVARFGGEEFVAILPQTDLAGAGTVAQTVRAAVAALELEHATSVFGTVTISIGVATSSTDDYLDSADLLRRADDCLYAAKSAGRNCVRTATGELYATHIAVVSI